MTKIMSFCDCNNIQKKKQRLKSRINKKFIKRQNGRLKHHINSEYKNRLKELNICQYFFLIIKNFKDYVKNQKSYDCTLF